MPSKAEREAHAALCEAEAKEQEKFRKDALAASKRYDEEMEGKDAPPPSPEENPVVETLTDKKKGDK